MPIIREIVPRGTFYTPYLFSKEHGLPKEAIRGYLELIQGLDIDGKLAYIEVGNKRFFYRYDVIPHDKPIILALSLQEAKMVSEVLTEWLRKTEK